MDRVPDFESGGWGFDSLRARFFCSLFAGDMNWRQLCVFTDNLSRLLADGFMFDKAVDIAGQCMRNRTNRKLAADIREVFLSGLDLQEKLADYDLPPFYPALLKCGHQTGRLPEALKAAVHFLTQIMPIACRLRRCRQLICVALMISILFRWFFLHRVSVITLILLTAFFFSSYSNKLKYWRDYLIAKLPFTGTWAQQLALMEFFITLEIAYDSRLPVQQMFQHSTSAVSNKYLRRQMSRCVDPIDKGQSFAAALKAAAFVPRGIVAAVNTNEISGTLEKCFHDLADMMKKIIEAKLEIIKYLSAALIIDAGLLLPLYLILTAVLPQEYLLLVTLFVGSLMGYVPFMCVRAAFSEYSKKAAGINLWYQQLEDKNLDV